MLSILLLTFLSIGEEYHCVMESGDVAKLKYRGVSLEDAFYRTAKACTQVRIHNYMITKLSEPSTERRILFMENCVNNIYCKEIKTNE